MFYTIESRFDAVLRIKITKSETGTPFKMHASERETEYATSHPRPYRNKIQNKISKEVKGKTNTPLGFSSSLERDGCICVSSAFG